MMLTANMAKSSVVARYCIDDEGETEFFRNEASQPCSESRMSGILQKPRILEDTPSSA